MVVEWGLVFVLVVGFFFPGLFFNHLPQVFITTDIYIKIRYLFMLNAAVLAACFFLLLFVSYRLDFHTRNSNN